MAIFERFMFWFYDTMTLQLSVYRGSSGVQAIVTANARKQAEQDESLVMASGIPYTNIRNGLLVNAPGGNQGFNIKEVIVIYV